MSMLRLRTPLKVLPQLISTAAILTCVACATSRSGEDLGSDQFFLDQTQSGQGAARTPASMDAVLANDTGQSDARLMPDECGAGFGSPHDIEVWDQGNAGWHDRYEFGPKQPGETQNDVKGMPWNEIWVFVNGLRIVTGAPEKYGDVATVRARAKEMRERLETLRKSDAPVIVDLPGGFMNALKGIRKYTFEPMPKALYEKCERLRREKMAVVKSPSNFGPRSIRVVEMVQTPLVGCVEKKQNIDGDSVETCTYEKDANGRFIENQPEYQRAYENSRPGQVKYMVVGYGKVQGKEDRKLRFWERLTEDFATGLEARVRARYQNRQIQIAKDKKQLVSIQIVRTWDGKPIAWIEPVSRVSNAAEAAKTK